MKLEIFHLIDRIAAIDVAAQTIVAEADVPTESSIFEGHFPGHPLMPGVLLIEAMAQTSGWLLIGTIARGRMPYLAAVKEAKLRTFVSPGQTVRIDANIEHEGSGFAVTDAKISIDGKTICNAALTFRLVPFPNDEMRRHMGIVAKKIGFPLETVAAQQTVAHE